MPHERAQLLEAEIPLALRQLRDIAPSAISPLAEDADIVLSLRFYFLTARIPLATAQVQHLSCPERLVFGFAPLLRVAKRPRHAASRLDRSTAAAGTCPPCLMLAPLLLSSPSVSPGQPARDENTKTSHLQTPETGLEPKYPAVFCVGCFWFGSCLVSIKQLESEPKYPKRQ